MDGTDGVIVSKRPRASNLSAYERSLLVDLCVKYTEVIDNKRTDSVSAKQKEAGWKQLADEFNSQTVCGTRRDWIQLKHSYDNLKQKVKKTLAADKVQRMKTGGGGFVSCPVDSVDEKLIGVLGNRATPLLNPFDADAAYNNESVSVFDNGSWLTIGDNTFVVQDESFRLTDDSNQQLQSSAIIGQLIGDQYTQPSTSAASTSLSAQLSESMTAVSQLAGASTAEQKLKLAPRSLAHRQWARTRRSRVTPAVPSCNATEKITEFVDTKMKYYERKLAMKEQEHELFLKQHEKRMKVLDLEEQFYATKLRKFGEE